MAEKDTAKKLRMMAELTILKKRTDAGQMTSSKQLTEELARYEVYGGKPTEDMRDINALWHSFVLLATPEGEALFDVESTAEELIPKKGNSYYFNKAALASSHASTGHSSLAMLVEECCKRGLPLSFFYTRVIHDPKTGRLTRVHSSSQPVQVYPLRVVTADAREYMLAFSPYWYLRDAAANGELLAQGKVERMSKKRELWGVTPYRVDRIEHESLELPGEDGWFAPQQNEHFEGRFWDALTFDNEDKLEEMRELAHHFQEKYPEVFQALCRFPYEIDPVSFAAQWVGETEEALRQAVNMTNEAKDFEELIGLQTTFGMYASPSMPASMYVRDTAFNGFFDRFGSQVEGISLKELSEEELVEQEIWQGGERDEGHTWVEVRVLVSPGASFYGWLMQFDGQIVLADASFLGDFKRYLDKTRKAYGD